jgi:hypothetical protein
MRAGGAACRCTPPSHTLGGSRRCDQGGRVAWRRHWMQGSMPTRKRHRARYLSHTPLPETRSASIAQPVTAVTATHYRWRQCLACCHAGSWHRGGRASTACSAPRALASTPRQVPQVLSDASRWCSMQVHATFTHIGGSPWRRHWMQGSVLTPEPRRHSTPQVSQVEMHQM